MISDGIGLIMNKETALLPCPFCGSPPKIEYHEHSDDAWIPEEWPLYFELGCTNKDCLLHGLIYMRQYWPNNPENLKMIKAWNSRSTNWQPIETAPRNGSYILTFTPENMEDENQVYSGINVASYEVDRWVILWADNSGGEYKPCACECKPTHWMPIPALPNPGH